MRYFYILFILISLMLDACTQESPVPTVTLTATQIHPTATFTPSPTITPTPPLVISTDMSKLENIPFLSWEYVISQQFVKDLIIMDNRGLLSEIPNTAVFITAKDSIVYKPDTPPSTIDRQFQNHGFEILFIPEWPAPYAAKLNQRPFVLIGIWSTEFGREKIFVLVNKWRNWDGTDGFLGYLFRPHPLVDLTDIVLGYENLSSFQTGIYFGKEQKGCEKYISNWEKKMPEFCIWYWENTEITLAPEIFRSWRETGILNNKVVGPNGETNYLLPIAPFGSKYIGPR